MREEATVKRVEVGENARPLERNREGPKSQFNPNSCFWQTAPTLAMCAEFSSEAVVVLAYLRALPLMEANAYCREMAPSPILEPLLQCP
jgi:hypothetical protein